MVTEKGRAAARDMEAAAGQRIRALTAHLTATQRDRLSALASAVVNPS